MSLGSGVLVLAASLAVPQAQAAPPHASRPVVVAVLGETGVNVLHQDFARPNLSPNPDLPPATLVSLPESGDFDQRLAQARKGPLGHLLAGRLYRIRDTNIVGVYNPVETGLLPYAPADLLADTDHGTGVVSALAGQHFGTAPEVQVVIVLGTGPASWGWIARQPWIDFVSTSWAQRVYSPPGTPGIVCDTYRESQAIAGRGGLVFSAIGNDPGMGALPPASYPDAYHVGGVDRAGKTVLVGASPQEATTKLGPDRPYESGELFDFAAASGFSLTESTQFGGTSGATPRMAGDAANLLALARQLLNDTGGRRPGDVLARASDLRAPRPRRGPLADGSLTRAELIALLHNTSSPHEQDPQSRYALEGFGAYDLAAGKLATRVLMGTSFAAVRSPEASMDNLALRARLAMWDARCTGH